jgi:hypothetical protein
MSPAWRDSVNNYAYRVNAYRQENLSYDWGMLFSFFPVAGEAYVDNTSKGFVYLGERVAAVALGTVGLIRLVRSDRTSIVDVGIIVVGVVGYAVLKYLEIRDVQHEVSRINEELVEKFAINVNDIDTASIRYPNKSWPRWVTERPPARRPHSAQDAIQNPVSDGSSTIRGSSPSHFRVGAQLRF